MNGNSYLIPANSKKSMLILGFFTPFDLTLFACGVGISVILLMLIKTKSIAMLLFLASPALITALLVMPVPNYHNVMTLIGNIWKFYSGVKKYRWRGWCSKYAYSGKDNSKSKSFR